MSLKIFGISRFTIQIKTKDRSQVRQYLNPTATPLTPKAIEKIRDAHIKQIPNRKHIMYANYKIGSERYDDIVNGQIYPQLPEIEITSMNSSISIPQPEILPIHSLSNARNPEQIIFLSKPVTKKTSRKKKVSQNEELSSSNIDKTNSDIELSKGGDQSESKTINHSISSIPGSDVQARIENL
ncbi:16124_t:CDS:2 [Cetraspora pellucida]|uniref:16124_t:CDS:1 n=1 Tax=Cetraspora pellucida TaxID=1433469 RepID=A0A9N9ARJ9_9GLOM|nr:16124_t:CDS:2 [Cetraspora pellucida]